MRQIVLDTETTGREVSQGNKVIEIGCLELINRRITGKSFHCYINPGRESEAGALAVHGLTQEFLISHPIFAHIVDDFLAFIKGAQLIIHNAPFDIGFLDHELAAAGSYGIINDYCTVLDTLPLARQLHPGQRNSLDALCKRYSVDASNRTLHGALVDAELLAKVYLAMTGGQTSFFTEESEVVQLQSTHVAVESKKIQLPHVVIKASADELQAHVACLDIIAKQAKTGCLWHKETTKND